MGKINFSNPKDTNKSGLSCNEDDQNDMSIFTKSTRHNQIVSLLTEIDETNINEDSPSKSILMHDKDGSELQNNITDEDGDEESFSISNKSCTIIHSLDDPSPPDPSDNSTSSSSDMFSDSSSDSSIMSKSNSSSSNDLPKKENNNFKKNRRPLSDKKLCNQALNMIKFLGTIHMKKLDLKHEPRLRRIAFLDWIGQLEIAFSSNEYTREVLKDYSTTTKIRRPTDPLADCLVYTVIYAFIDKNTRTSTATYKNKGTDLLRCLHIKCASYDANSKLRARLAFVNCKISQEETAINFLTRLEQKANEARNFDMKISERKFIWILLNNMKHHRFYKERIAALLTTFELNPSSISQKWIENKFYSLDEERIISFRNKFRESARFSLDSNKTHKYQGNEKKTRCRYCYRAGHTDNNCQDRANKRPPSMPEWISKATCAKCKKKGHLAFNCPPTFGNKMVKSK